MDIKRHIIEILNREIKPAIGCTEPVAVALNTAYGVSILPNDSKEISKITVEVSKGIYKNGMDVGIPNTNKIGLHIAASLGASIGDPKCGLEILGKITNEELKYSEKILESCEINVKVDKDNNKPVYIKTTIENKDHVSIAITEDKHDNIVLLSIDGNEILNKRNGANKENNNDNEEQNFYNLPINTIVEEIEKLDYEDIKFLLDGMEMNMNIAKEGLDKKHGLGVGYSYNSNMKNGLISKDFVNLAYALTAAASDVRMSGYSMPVMSSSGSGNNGLTAILPLAAYKEIMKISDEDLVKALAISHIITSYVKRYIGRLSNLCGCSIAASIGSGAAIAWLLGDKNAITSTINNIIANQAGVICDGAKPSCALKLGTAASTAVQSALLAIEGITIKDFNGIVDNQVEKSIRNLAKLSGEGMKNIDDTVIEIMLNR
ncbi:L-serine ammonia-lyase, iron-sulfur-dependent, subunit alpha [uncultured Tissierella sp.]|uniref:L-cysteine desulfidase family protein n=1 Tax=uncultured Tissierella sp. TaxID=448160 RepID=UPI0028063BEE|nr:L-serine ammonia-lyase, iron-sulfur-dependent, subunit alpha [uncultured Tissierella sp.]MDU5081846.1 L-serine ammonia-lyase, iron-sulfur-dependent, subunit alpha [Bacillota bacterium]